MKRFAGLLAMPMLLCADWRIVTKTGDSTLTEYFKGTLMRVDSSPTYTTVMDVDRRRQVNWRSDLHQYEIVEWPPDVQPNSSSRVITIERSTIDTGERKQLLGRTARHLISRIKRSDGPETVIDAWYVEVPGLPKRKTGFGGAVAVLTQTPAGQSPAPPRIDIKQVGPSPDGLAVWQKTTSAIALPGGAAHKYESVSEVTQLVEGTLSDKLFRPPDGYQQVTNLYASPRKGQR
jgi:hypothetical protein